MKYNVKFLVKCMDERNYGLLLDRVKKFDSMQAALQFSKTINNYIPEREVLVGKPLIEDAA